MKDELKGIRKDQMKIGASLADVDPMQIDTSVSVFYFKLLYKCDVTDLLK